MMGALRRVLILAGLVGLIFPTWAGAQELPPHNRVDIAGLQFIPPLTVVEAGEPVVWRNTEPAAHPLDARHNVIPWIHAAPGGVPEIRSGVLCPVMAPGQTCTVQAGSTALPRGTHVYICTVNEVHAALMRGVVVVQ